MKRTLPLIVATTLAVASPGLQALDLDEMQVQSRLDEPLRARIPLIDLQGIDSSRLRVHLANKAEFQEAGLPRADLIDDLHLAINREGGDPMLLLSTDQAVSEPYLELLLTLEWPGGEQRRQINVLLDPPAYRLPPSLLTAAQTSKSAERNTQRESVADQPLLPTSKPAVSVDAARKTAGALPHQLVVERGNTLWSLADGIRRQFEVSTEQAMLALFRSNPRAFEADNINTLQAGTVLAIPSRAAMTSIDSRQARQQVLEQNRAWSSAQPDTVASSSFDETASVSSAETVMVDAEAAIALYGGIEKAEAAKAAAVTETLDILPESSVSSAVLPQSGISNTVQSATNASELQANLVSAEELESVTARQDERLSALESNLKMTNDTLAQVREQSDQLGGMMASLRKSVEGLHDRLVASLQPEPLESSGIGLSGLVQQMKGNMITVGGVAAIALLLPLALLRRRQRSRVEKHEEVEQVQPPSVAQESDLSWMQDEMQDEMTARAVPMSVADEFQDSPAQAQTLNDADVFIAYGRHAAARELLEQELENAPERHDLRLKLLSVYIALDEREAAEREADFLQNHAQPAYHQEVQRLLASLDAQYEDAVFEQATQETPSFEMESSFETDDSDILEPVSEPPVMKNEEKATQYPFDEHVIDYQPPNLQVADTQRPGERSSEIVYPSNLELAKRDRQGASPLDQQSDSDENWDIQEITFEPGRKSDQYPAPEAFRH
nr:FimV/HubP family polar landmark protein [uncultured Halomonas sp.]